MAKIPDDYMRPEMMAIGDSLYQGVRSLTIKNGLNQLSAPAQVAEALGIRHRFACPDPRRPVLVDMEAWLRLFPDLGAVKADLAKNVDYWFAKPASPSGCLLFDNVAVASATIADLYSHSWQSADDYLKGLPRGAKGKIKKLEFGGLEFGAIVQALNTRFTLNPSGRRAFRELTQVGLAAARRPRRLLVNIGANNGLWEIAFEANPRGRVVYRRDLKMLAGALNALPPEVEHIYFNNLGLPSSVPNLMPLPDHVELDEANKPGQGKYYGRYENRFGFGYGSMTGRQLERLDKHLREVNKEACKILRDAFDNRARLHFVDLAELLSSYDSKHQKRTASNVVKLANEKTITNVMIEAGLFGNFRRGGSQDLDGMHPTVVGYALMAQRVLDTIAAAEPGVTPGKIDLDAAFDRDKLLNGMPDIWSLGLWLWRDVRRALAGHAASPAKDDDEKALCEIMAASARGLGRRAG
ncbi:MAG: hypothetical protein OEM59_03810 [Rhodospirillales bacterium]|nr:hypothetical protein [Rhodospirillales bacterium]